MRKMNLSFVNLLDLFVYSTICITYILIVYKYGITRFIPFKEKNGVLEIIFNIGFWSTIMIWNAERLCDTLNNIFKKKSEVKA